LSIFQEELAKASAISVRSLRDKLKILEQMKILNIKSKNTYRTGGGSYACIYCPEFPTGYGFIKQFETNSKHSELEGDSLDKIRRKDEELRHEKYF
jgi:transcription initiation factor IIE alpha subunit